jgi:hypothetical protein
MGASDRGITAAAAQSMIPASSAADSDRDSTTAQVPSGRIRRCQVQIVCQGPNTSGTSRQAIPHRYR